MCSMNQYECISHLPCPLTQAKLIAVYSFRQVLPPTFMWLKRLHISRPLVYVLCFDVCIERCCVVYKEGAKGIKQVFCAITNGMFHVRSM